MNRKNSVSLLSCASLLIVCIWLSGCVVAPCPHLTMESEAREGQGLYQRVRQATVEVLVDDRLSGSGWFCDPEGIIVTAAHVIERPGRRVEILLPVVGRIEAKVIAVDKGHDLALLRVEKPEEPYPALSFAEAMPCPGTQIFALGVPQFRHAVMVSGTVARSEPVHEWIGGTHSYVEIIHVSANTPKGISGAPWFDMRGQVVGLQSSMMVEGTSQVGIAFVSPTASIRSLLASCCNARTPTLGIPVEEVWEEGFPFLKGLPPRTQGLVVRAPVPDGPAWEAGVREWDIITEVDGKPVAYRDELLRQVRSLIPGDTMELTLLPASDRKNSRKVMVELGTLEKAWE